METATNQWEDTQLTAPFDGLPGEIFTPTEIFVSQNITTNNISFLLTAIIMNPENRLFGAQQIKKEILTHIAQLISSNSLKFNHLIFREALSGALQILT